MSTEAINRLAAIGQMSAGIAHEIRNPLTTVKGFLQLLQKEFPHQYWDYIFPELDQAISTVQNLLHVSKPELASEQYVPVSLCAELESLLYLFHEQMYRVKVETYFRDKEISIVAKRSHIKRAVFNILKNAFESIMDTGKITIEHYRDESVICLVIRDTGFGIPKNQIELLGTPFFTTKDTGVGMGLTQAYASFYEHDAEIEVESQIGEGTTFMIKFPIEGNDKGELRDLNLVYAEGQSLKDFFKQNLSDFDEMLQSAAKETFDLVAKNQMVNQAQLMKDAHELTELLIEGVNVQIISLAKERGTVWARSDLPVISKLTWFQALRSVVWQFIYTYYSKKTVDSEFVFKLERRINHSLDVFIDHFFASYTKYRDELLRSQRELIDELSVPVIPIMESMAVLPLVGTLDTYRAKKIQESVLTEISRLSLSKLVIDLSGVAFMDSAVVGHLFRIVDGIKLLGCKAVLTGIRPEIANTMIDFGIALDEKIEIQSTLQQAMVTR